MAHFAEIDQNGNVLQVQVINNDDIDGGNFPESEPLGQALQAALVCVWSAELTGAGVVCVDPSAIADDVAAVAVWSTTVGV